MSFLRRVFRRSDSEDYEQILSALAADVQKRQTRLAEIRLRERRTTLHFTLGTFLLWFAYVSLWYTRTLPQMWRDSRLGQAAMLVGPILILFARRMMQIWYSWKGGREEKTLMTVLKKQRAKVEEIKKKTNYYSTRNLLEKYDEQSSVTPTTTPIRRRSVAPSVSPTPLQLKHQQQQHPQTPNGQTQASPLQLSPTPQPIQATRKQWYDKLADAILGDEESSVSVAASRYALICQKCFAHNGLVKETQWEDTQYICFKCGFFNPSARSKKKLAVSRTPSPPSTSGPSPVRSAEYKPQSTAAPEQSPDRHSASRELKSADDSVAMDTE